MSYEHRDDPVLVLARRMTGESAGWAWFGIHEPNDPTYEAERWDEPYSREVAKPAWSGDVMRVVWKAPLLLPDECGDRVPTPLEINADRLPWLRAPYARTSFVAGMKLSEFCLKIAEIGGDVYVPLVGVQDKDWQRWSESRPALNSAGRYA